MPEIFDVLAKVSWDTNTEELNKGLSEENKILLELEQRGKRLEQQMQKTNDPKKVAAVNQQLAQTKKAQDSIIDGQKKQLTATDELRKKQQQLAQQMLKTNDPKQLQGLIGQMNKLGNELTQVGAKASGLGTKLSGIGQGLLSGFGLGIGVGATAAIGTAISGFVTGAIDEIEQAERAARNLGLALDATGKREYLAGLIDEATRLSKEFGNIFDNDEITAAQTELVKFGRFTRAELSQLTEVAINLAAATGTDVPSAANKLVDILAGRGAATLRDFGISLKGAKTDSERLAIVLTELDQKVSGAALTYAASAEGIRKSNEKIINDTKEALGEKLLPVYASFLQGVNDLLSGRFNDVFMRVTGQGAVVDAMNAYKRQTDALVGGIIDDINKLEKAIYKAEQAGVPGFLTSQMKQRLEDLRALKQDTQRINSGLFAEEEVVKETAKKAQKEADKEENKVKIKVTLSADELIERPGAIQGEVQRAVTKIENSPEFQRAESQREVDRQKRRDEEQRQQKEDERAARQQLFDEVQNASSVAQDLIAIEQRKTDKLIALQEDRVNAARGNSAASLKIEQDRLNELIAKRERFERTQRTIDAAVIAANQAVAISGAIATIANSKNPVLIAANVIAILAGIGATIAAIRSINAGAGFKEGGYTGDGDPSEESTAIGKRPYKYHKKEFVMDEGLTSKHRDMFEGLHKRNLVVQRMDDGSFYLAPDTHRMAEDFEATRESASLMPLLSEMSQMRKLLQQREVNISQNFDADGFGQAVAVQMGQINLKRKRA